MVRNVDFPCQSGARLCETIPMENLPLCRKAAFKARAVLLGERLDLRALGGPIISRMASPPNHARSSISREIPPATESPGPFGE